MRGYLSCAWRVGLGALVMLGMERSAAAIEGGTPTEGAKGTIGICFGTDTPPHCRYACSGTLVAPNLVLTARHCVEKTPIGQTPNCDRDQFQGPQDDVSPATTWVTTNAKVDSTLTGWHHGKQFVLPLANRICGGDLVAIVLEDQVFPSEAAPVNLAVQPPLTDPRYSRTVAIAGHGETTVGDTTSLGQRRVLQNAVVECIPGDPVIDCAKLGKADGRVAKEFLVHAGGCKGDSGGAALDQKSYTDGTLLQLGVLSRGGESGGSCITNTYVRVDAAAPFLLRAARTAAEANQTPLPTWAQISISGPQPGAINDIPFGEAGAECDADSDCQSGRCASNDSGLTFTCVSPCGAGNTCASGFKCETSGSTPLCFYVPPADDPPGCATARGRRTSWGDVGATALSGLALLLLTRRRRGERL